MYVNYFVCSLNDFWSFCDPRKGTETGSTKIMYRWWALWRYSETLGKKQRCASAHGLYFPQLFIWRNIGSRKFKFRGMQHHVDWWIAATISNGRSAATLWVGSPRVLATCPWRWKYYDLSKRRWSIIIISNLSNDRSKASSKTIPPHSAI